MSVSTESQFVNETGVSEMNKYIQLRNLIEYVKRLDPI
jgi:hypothetical protein